MSTAKYPYNSHYTMTTTPEHDAKIANMTFSSVYPHYVTKVEKKGRTEEELQQVIEWLTGFDKKTLDGLIEEKVTFKTFFERANLNPNQTPLSRLWATAFPIPRSSAVWPRGSDMTSQSSRTRTKT